MPNCYCNLGIIKSSGTLNIMTGDWDSQLLRVAEDASRQVDNDTDRFFYIYEGSFYQDGAANRVILDWDVQTITSLIVDINGQNQYPTTSEYTIDMNAPTTAPDAFTYPSNGLPKTRLEANPFGDYGHLGAGYRKAIKITGTFGHGNDWPNPNTHALQGTVNADLTSTAATVTVTSSTATEIVAGMTLRVNAEQLYVYTAPTGSSGQFIPVQRAQNGTPAAAATTGTTISVYDYPQPIVQATLIELVRLWKRRESGYVNTIINTDMGSITVFKGTDPDYQRIVNKYHKVRSMGYL